MTILFEPIANIAGEIGVDYVKFSVPRVRLSFDGTATIVKTVYRAPVKNGVMTTQPLDPGTAEVTIGHETRTIDIPDSGIPLRLQPLWDAAEPQPENPDGFVRNAGGFDRVQVMTMSQFTSQGSPDPNTTFILFPD
jgi:hypothetical protein